MEIDKDKEGDKDEDKYIDGGTDRDIDKEKRTLLRR